MFMAVGRRRQAGRQLHSLSSPVKRSRHSKWWARLEAAPRQGARWGAAAVAWHARVPALPVPAATALGLSALPPQSPCSRQTSAASSKMRGFPILPVSDPSARVRGRSAVRSKLSSLPHVLPGSRGGSCFGRDGGRGKRDRKRHPGPLSLGEAGSIHRGKGQAGSRSHLTPGQPCLQ